MRRFQLINSLGKKWDLNDSRSFFHDVSGLGLERKASYTRAGTRYMPEEDVLAQKQIKGKICFTDYEQYRQFVMFIQYKPLVLVYNIGEEYRIRVSIDKLEKKELATGGLYSNITMKSLGTYYKTVKRQNFRSADSEGKAYPLAYPYAYYDAASGTVIVDSDSVMESGIRISIFGPCTNPSYIHYLNGEVKADGKVNVTVEDGYKLIIDSTVIPYSIKLCTVRNELVKDVYDKSDFSTERFLLLESGVNKISFMHESSEAINISVEAEIEYESV
ncbi:MAG: hypothetical protein E7290_02010 [Lachnospiraceae bacterium]|nr:hypothetical protein [Lachnospiraceae bacterium]